MRAKLAAGALTLDKFVITKQLTKRPEDYPDAKNQPHVQVALRRKAANKRDGTMQVQKCLSGPRTRSCTCTRCVLSQGAWSCKRMGPMQV